MKSIMKKTALFGLGAIIVAATSTPTLASNCTQSISLKEMDTRSTPAKEVRSFVLKTTPGYPFHIKESDSKEVFEFDGEYFDEASIIQYSINHEVLMNASEGELPRYDVFSTQGNGRIESDKGGLRLSRKSNRLARDYVITVHESCDTNPEVSSK